MSFWPILKTGLKRDRPFYTWCMLVTGINFNGKLPEFLLWIVVKTRNTLNDYSPFTVKIFKTVLKSQTVFSYPWVAGIFLIRPCRFMKRSKLMVPLKLHEPG